MLLTDSRDVLFQDDPFKGFNGGLMVFEEDCKIKLANDKINSTWIKDLFGSYALSQLGSYPILCAGTIMADAKSMRHFLFEYEKLVCRIHKITNGGDQGILNYLFRCVIESDFNVGKNGQAQIFTMSPSLNLGIDFKITNDNVLVNLNDVIFPVLHQYDRHPQIASLLLNRLVYD